jgi:2-haloacid dehalogenase
MAAAMRRRLRLAGADEGRAAAALELVSTMPAYLEAPGALESLRARGLKLGVLSQSSAHATDSVLRFSGLRDRFELVLSAQDAGAFKPDLRPYRYALEQTGADAGSAVCMVSTHWWDVAGAKRAGLRTGWVARRERALLDTVPAPDYTGSDLAEVADAIVTRMT